MASKLKAKKPTESVKTKSKLLIFGASGVGKTWFSLMFPNPYYIDTEGGASLEQYQKRLESSCGVYMGVKEGSLDFDTVIGQMQALATEKHDYKTLIIDSVTKLYQTEIANESERILGSGKEDAFGASKKPAIRKMRSLVNWAMKLDMNIVFIAHEVTEWGILNGQRSEIGKIADVWDKLIYELDLTLQIIKAGSSRFAVVRKSRLQGFTDSEKFQLKSGAEFDEFAERYGKDFIMSEVKQLTLATPEQVSEIERLIKVLNIPQTEVDKILTRASADSFAEVTNDNAVATLKWLNSKIKGENKE